MEAHAGGKEEKAGRRILITGASGFLATHLIKALPGESLILVSRNPALRYRYPKAEFILFSMEALAKAVKRAQPDVVVNFIGILEEKRGATYEDVHYEVVKALVDAVSKLRLFKFIHISALGAGPHSKSRYHRTKWMAEEYIKKSGIPSVILKPSIVLGQGQRLYKDLKVLSQFTPVLPAPKIKVQPVRVEKVIDAIKRAIYTQVTGTFELCGEEVMSMAELFKRVLKEQGINRVVVELPRPFFFLPALLGLGMTMEQYYMIEDNVCKGEVGNG